MGLNFRSVVGLVCLFLFRGVSLLDHPNINYLRFLFQCDQPQCATRSPFECLSYLTITLKRLYAYSLYDVSVVPHTSEQWSGSSVSLFLTLRFPVRIPGWWSAREVDNLHYVHRTFKARWNTNIETIIKPILAIHEVMWIDFGECRSHFISRNQMYCDSISLRFKRKISLNKTPGVSITQVWCYTDIPQ